MKLFALTVFLAHLYNCNGLEGCKVLYDKVGCFKDTLSNRRLPDLLITDRDPSIKNKFGQSFDWKDFEGSLRSLLCRCATKAKTMGYKYIGIQFFAECWAGKDKQYAMDGPSKQCMQSYASFGKEKCNYGLSTDCAGLGYANFVYSLLDCQDRVDIALLLDVSSSVKGKALENAKKFIKNLIDELPLTKKGTRLSLVTFTKEAKVVFDFNSIYNKGGQEAKLKNFIDTISGEAGSTWPDSALKQVDEVLFTSQGGVRQDSPRFVITISDGNIHQESVIALVWHKLKIQKRAEFLSVAVGDDYNLKELTTLANPGPINVVDGNLDGAYKALLRRIKEIATTKCKNLDL